MTRSLPLLLCTLLCAALPAMAQVKTPATPETMNQLYAAYWEDYLRENPIAATFNGDARYNDRFGPVSSAEERKQSRALSEKYLAASAKFDPAPLPAEDRISYDLLRYRLQQVLDGLRFPSDLVPVDQFSGLHLMMAQLGSGASTQPFQTVQDYDNWLARAAGYAPAVDNVIADMRLGIKQGIVMPKALITRVLPQLESVGSDDLATSTYMGPVKKFPASFSAADKARLTDAYGKLVREQLAPANRKLLAFMRDTYLPAGRTTAGIGALPGGKEWYAFRARQSTTTDLTPAQIHDIGLSEVARIRAQFEEAKVRVGFKGTLRQFFDHLNNAPELRFTSREEIQAAYEGVRPQVEAKVGQLFANVPKAPFEIRPVEAFREVSAAPASYQRGSVDGKRPGIFYYNAYKPETRTRFTTNAFFLHEAIPGHVQRSRQGAPDRRIRQAGARTARARQPQAAHVHARHLPAGRPHHGRHRRPARWQGMVCLPGAPVDHDRPDAGADPRHWPVRSSAHPRPVRRSQGARGLQGYAQAVFRSPEQCARAALHLARGNPGGL